MKRMLTLFAVLVVCFVVLQPNTISAHEDVAGSARATVAYCSTCDAMKTITNANQSTISSWKSAGTTVCIHGYAHGTDKKQIREKTTYDLLSCGHKGNVKVTVYDTKITCNGYN